MQNIRKFPFWPRCSTGTGQELNKIRFSNTYRIPLLSVFESMATGRRRRPHQRGRHRRLVSTPAKQILNIWRRWRELIVVLQHRRRR